MFSIPFCFRHINETNVLVVGNTSLHFRLKTENLPAILKGNDGSLKRELISA